MFCNQCEQASGGVGCVRAAICGKSADNDLLQDLLVYVLSGLSEVATVARSRGLSTSEADVLLCEALFATLTNVNFDDDRMVEYINKAVEVRDKIKSSLGDADFVLDSVDYVPSSSRDLLVSKGEEVELKPEKSDDDPDVFSLKQTVLYGLKGIAAYAYHAYELGKKSEELFGFMHSALYRVFKKGGTLDEWVELALDVGKYNILAMELLDAAHTETFGHPEPTKVSLGAKKGKAILVSGHDLKAIYELLKQTEGKGINIYTHCEMLPAHGYPRIKSFSHLVGHFGTAWQNQQKEFPDFPGPIIMTTNCLMPPKQTYKDRLYTMGPVGYPGVEHIKGFDFSKVIEKALALPGYENDVEGKSVMVGFARNAVLSVADKVIELVKSGKIRHFFLVGGCDGAKLKRNYYTEFVEKAPKDTVILTLACGKFRFFDKDLGDIEGIPRLLDVGQCNDAYSAVQIALALAKAFNVGVNDLPLSLVISWYEQKAVAILLSLLYLGIKDIKIGPTPPAFFTPNVIKFLQDKYNLQLIKTPEEDLKEILGQ